MSGLYLCAVAVSGSLCCRCAVLAALSPAPPRKKRKRKKKMPSGSAQDMTGAKTVKFGIQQQKSQEPRAK